MVKSELVRFRAKPKLAEALRTAKKILQFGDTSNTVRHLLHAGLAYVQHIEKRKKDIKEEFEKYGYEVSFYPTKK
jgi:hypothetical protein